MDRVHVCKSLLWTLLINTVMTGVNAFPVTQKNRGIARCFLPECRFLKVNSTDIREVFITNCKLATIEVNGPEDVKIRDLNGESCHAETLKPTNPPITPQITTDASGTSNQNTEEGHTRTPQTTEDGRTRTPQTTEDGRTQTPQTTEDGQTRTPQTTEKGQTWTPQTTEDGRTRTPQTTEDGRTQTPQTTEDSRTQTPQTTEKGQTRTPQTTEDGRTRTPQTTEKGQTRTPQTTEDSRTRIPQTTEKGQTRTPQTTEDSRIRTPQTTEDGQTQSPQSTDNLDRIIQYVKDILSNTTEGTSLSEKAWGFLAWAIASSITVAILLLKKWLKKKFEACTRETLPTTDQSQLSTPHQSQPAVVPNQPHSTPYPSQIPLLLSTITTPDITPIASRTRAKCVES